MFLKRLFEKGFERDQNVVSALRPLEKGFLKKQKRASCCVCRKFKEKKSFGRVQVENQLSLDRVWRHKIVFICLNLGFWDHLEGF